MAFVESSFLNVVRFRVRRSGDPSRYKDVWSPPLDQPLSFQPFELISRHMIAEYDRLTVDRVFVDFEAGVGLATGQGSNPQAMLQVSRDGGHSWGNEVWTTIGAIGEYKTRAEWRRLGTAKDFVFKVRVTDPVKRIIAGAAMDAEKGAS